LAHLTWTRNLDLGIEVIDKQHGRIVSYINDLDDAMRLPAPGRRKGVLAVLKNAMDYTESHFSYEEAMLENVRYPFLKAHHKLHAMFIGRMNDYKRRFADGEDIGIELHNTLARWLVNHIQSEDADYAKYVKKHLAASRTAQPIPPLKPRDAATASLWRRLFGK
jgi:hemerythrin